MPARLDLPVVWLAITLLSTLVLAQLSVQILGPGSGLWVLAGWVFGLASVGLILWAVVQMRQAATAVMPGKVPSHLVTEGPFSFSRNPIYVGMVGIVVALALVLRAPVALIMVPMFMQVLTKRFILSEEQRLDATFGTEFREWQSRTARWVGLPSSQYRH